MIKLTLSSDSSPSMTRRFSQSEIIIGGDHALDADIKLPGQSLQDRHLLITKEEENGQIGYFVTNQTNDPFITLNNLPFGKQPLYDNDSIQIGDYTIRFETEPALEDEEGQENVIRNRAEEPGQLSFRLETDPDNAFDADSLKSRKKKNDHNPLNNVSDLSFPYSQNVGFQFQEKNTPPIPSNPSPLSPPAPKLSLKDYYLSEYDDNEELPLPNGKKNQNRYAPPQQTKTWGSFFTVLTGFLFALAITAGLTYLWLSDQTGEEETAAAKSVADIAMALTYAQSKNIHPQNQNWSYPEFIKNNLTAVLAPNYSPLGEIDAHGQFANCSYMLRVYTSSDLSQFLVIAQPSPSLLQWLIPKASIIVDSIAMELRKVNDLKPLNRIIVNASGLDGTYENELTDLIKQGELIPISRLVSKIENQGFSPPKALSLMHPGAENYIYNAPRYYLLGETLLENALELVDKHNGSKEASIFQQELQELLKYPDFIFYSSSGLQHAIKAQKALTSIAPKDNFLVAYLQLNARGKISNTHLLIDDDHPSEIAEIEKQTSFKEVIGNGKIHSDTLEAEKSFFENQPIKVEELKYDIENPVEIDEGYPLFLQLSKIAQQRQAALKPYASETIALIKKETASPQSDFSEKLDELQQKYKVMEKEQQEIIFKKFNTLMHDNSYLPANEFINFIQAANLKTIFKEYLDRLKQKATAQNSTDQHIEQLFNAIRESRSWHELEHNTAQANQVLQFDHIPDEHRLITYQNTARSLATQKLNQFILSSTEALPANSFNADYLQTLTNILKAVWITDPNTHEFYIGEFELRDPNH